MPIQEWQARVLNALESLAGAIVGTAVTVVQANPDNLNANANIQVGDVDVSNANPVPVAPFSGIPEAGLIELIGDGDRVDQFEYSNSVAIALGSARSGEILRVSLYVAADTGATGTIITEGGVLLFFDADPAVGAGDANLAAAEWPTIIAKIDIDASDWFEENANSEGALCSFDVVPFVPVAFQELATLYVVYYHQGATSWNDGAGDDETLSMNAWYRRES